MIAGTIRNTVMLQQMDNKWQQKKTNLGKKQSEMTEEERLLRDLQEQAESIRTGNTYAKIDAKIKAGGTLTAEEVKYLRENYPQALENYEEIQREKEAYERQLKNCKTKEDVEKVKVQKLGGFMAEAKKISSNPYIGKSQKCALLGKILAKVTAVSKVHYEFTKSLRYQSLPTEEEKQAKEAAAEITVPEQMEDIQQENLPAEKNKTTEYDIPAAAITFEQAEKEISDFLKKENTRSKKINVTV